MEQQCSHASPSEERGRAHATCIAHDYGYIPALYKLQLSDLHAGETGTYWPEDDKTVPIRRCIAKSALASIDSSWRGGVGFARDMQDDAPPTAYVYNSAAAERCPR